MKVKSESEVAQSCPTLATPWTAAYQEVLHGGPWDFLGKSTGVGCHCLTHKHLLLRSIANKKYISKT